MECDSISTNLPGVEHHVEQESPDLEPLVRPIDENGFNGHRTRWVHLAHHHRVVREETQLQILKMKFKF